MHIQTKRLQESVLMRGLDLAESARWRDYSASIREGYRRKHKTSIPQELLATTATLLENTRKYFDRMDEATKVVNTGNFVDYGIALICASVRVCPGYGAAFRCCLLSGLRIRSQ